jgi:4-hydroxy-tetrahydrodipicolinate synthase
VVEPETVVAERRLAGVTPILLTPYDAKGRIAFDDVGAEVDHLARLDVAVAGIGFGSDILRLTERERDELVRRVAAQAAGRLAVLASTGANSTAAAIERAQAAADAGADILMVIPPGSVSMAGEHDIVEYYGGIEEATGMPLVVQDAPGLTGTTMSAQLLARISVEVPNVVALKVEATPSAPKIGELAGLEHGSAGILGGAGGIDFYHELARGADGTVPGVAFTELFIEVERRFRDDRAGARELFDHFLPLVALSNRDGPAFYRTQLEMFHRRGIVVETHLRDPAREDARLLSELDELLEALAMPDGRWDLGRHG